MANIASQATITINGGRWSNGDAAQLVDGLTENNSIYAVDNADIGRVVFTFASPLSFSAVKVWNNKANTPDYIRGTQVLIDGASVFLTTSAVGNGGAEYSFSPTVGTILTVVFANGTSGVIQRVSEIAIFNTTETTVAIDTLRSLVSVVSVPADTSRVLSGPVSVSCDTSRLITDAVSVSVDTLRSIVRIESVSADTLRSLIQTVSAPIDTRRRIVGPLSNIKQLTIGLAAQVLGDSFTLDAYTAPALKTPYGSTLYGWPWEFVVRSKQYDPATKKYSWAGDYDIADLLKKYVVFNNTLFDSDDIMSAIASRLGKSLVIAADKHSINPLASTTKIMDAISSLYSWTSSIPHQLVNVFLRGDTLYVLQRGEESSSYEPIKYNIVSIEESQMDTLMDQKTGDPKITGEALTINVLDTGNGNISETESYFSGTWSGGGATVTFQDGLNIRTITISNTQTTDTINSYNGDRTISSKTIAVSDSANPTANIVTDTVYSYSYYEGLPYLSREATEVRKSGAIQTTTETNYSPLGFNFYSCTQSSYNSAGKRIGFYSYISEGRPGGIASPYAKSREAVWNAMNLVPSVSISRNPLYPSSIPATDISTVTRYKNGLEWLDGKTQYVLNIECWDDHVMDYTETITINGLTWYLNSNQIVITGDQPKAKQTASLVRWA